MLLTLKSRDLHQVPVYFCASGFFRKETTELSALLSDLPPGLNTHTEICYEYNVQQ